MYSQLQDQHDASEDRTAMMTSPVPVSAEEIANRKWRADLNDLLNRPESSTPAQVLHYFIITVIIASTAGVIVETMPEFRMNPIFFPLEMCITALFTLEFSLRLYSCEHLHDFVSNCYNLIDLLAIFPGYLELVILLVLASERGEGQGSQPTEEMEHVHKAASSMRTLRMIRMVRLVRVFRVIRIAKVARHSQLLSILVKVFVKVAQSGLVVVLMIMAFATVLSASLIFIFESELCEDSGVHCVGPSAFVSIPASFWWAIATLTTVGYGDMVPHTAAGKIIGGLTAVAGMIIVAIGIALVSLNFRECFIEEKARADAKRQGGGQGPEEEKEMDELVRNFEQCASELLAKLRAVAVRQEESEQLTAMLDVLMNHSEVLSSDVKVLIEQVLAHRSKMQNSPRRPTQCS
mmetsp:Transcript_97489/g.218172  ORF Transcript_97489/g.218172 Transcript_97489/m.218172 type:complete len:406 (+) Transcript_97489:143-1360(+)